MTTYELPKLNAARAMFADLADRYGYGPDGAMPGDECEIGEACWWLAKVRRSQASEASDYQAVAYECDALADGDQRDEAVKLAAAAVVVAAADEATCRKAAAYWRSPIKAAGDPTGSKRWGDEWATQADEIKAVADELTSTWLTDDDGDDGDGGDGDGGDAPTEPTEPVAPTSDDEPTDTTGEPTAYRETEMRVTAAGWAARRAMRTGEPVDGWQGDDLAAALVLTACAETQDEPAGKAVVVGDRALGERLLRWLLTDEGRRVAATQLRWLTTAAEREANGEADARRRCAAEWQAKVEAARRDAPTGPVEVTASDRYLCDYADRLLRGGRYPQRVGASSSGQLKLRSVDELADLLADADAMAELAVDARRDRDDHTLALARAGERLTARAVRSAAAFGDLPAKPLPPAPTAAYWLVVACYWARDLPRAEGGI